jgi:hypothetical protein
MKAFCPFRTGVESLKSALPIMQVPTPLQSKVHSSKVEETIVIETAKMTADNLIIMFVAGYQLGL